MMMLVVRDGESKKDQEKKSQKGIFMLENWVGVE